MSSTAAHADDGTTRFRISHPFHPRRGTEYVLVTRRFNWGEDRVFYHDAHGNLLSLATYLTDLVPPDAFALAAAGRSAFRIDDLLELRARLDACLDRAKGGSDA
jgi:Family of unknown function (DUF5372)